MKYVVVVGGRTLDLEVDASGRTLLAGRVVAAEVVPHAGGIRRVSIEGGSYEVAVVGRAPLRVQVDGREVTVSVADARTRSVAPAAAGHSGRSELRAPMPGLLKAVHVREGDIVERGAAVVTLEAMKMENELRARSRARVARIVVGPGTKVERDALLVLLEAAP